MKTIEKVKFGYLVFSVLALLYVSILGLISPHQVMEMVQVNLDNTDAISSIRGVYGGVGLTICISLIYLLLQKPDLAFAFMIMFWGAYALSRIMTIFLEGSLGDFGSNWLKIESRLFLIGIGLLFIKKFKEI